jgi:DNA polymerase-3 subunit gamma/tau
LRLLDDLVSSGQGLDVFAQGVILNFRNLLLLKIDAGLASALELAPEQVQALASQAERFQKQDLLALIDRASLHYERIHRSSQPRILLEAALVEFTLFESRVLLSDLVRRLQALESGGGAGDESSHAHDTADSARSAGSRRSGEADLSGQSNYRASGGTGHVRESGGPATRDQGQASPAAADTVPGWSSFIQVLLDSHPGLASCLMEGLPSLDGERNRLVVGFPREKNFQMERLTQERATLEDRVSAHWGRRLRVDLIVTTQADVGEVRETVRRQVVPTEKENLIDACRDDQSLAELVELLQGEPASPQERETWRAVQPDPGPRDSTEMGLETSGDGPDSRKS